MLIFGAAACSGAGRSTAASGSQAALAPEEVQQLGEQLCTHLDNKYGRKGGLYWPEVEALEKQLAAFRGGPVRIKAYGRSGLAAFALPNGCIRVFSGLFELFDEEELRFIAAVQAAHIREGTSRERFSSAFAQLGRSSGSTPAALTPRELDRLESLLERASYTAEQEISADNLALQLSAERGQDASAAIRVMQKLFELRSTYATLFAGRDTITKRAAALKSLAADLPKGAAERPAKPLARKPPQAVRPERTEPISEADLAKLEQQYAALQNKDRLESEASKQPESGEPAGDSPVQARAPAPPAKQSSPPARRAVAASKIVPGWYIQVAADPNELDAVSRANVLKSLSYASAIEPVDIDNGRYFRVLVGPFPNRDAAESEIRAILEYQAAGGAPFVKEVK